MNHKSFVGISGECEGRALYLIGHNENNFACLDPHTTQLAIPNIESLWAQHLTYHCEKPLYLPFDTMNTSFAIGKLEYNQKDFI